MSSFRYGRPFNFQRWLDDNSARLKPPVGNQQIWANSGLLCTVVGLYQAYKYWTTPAPAAVAPDATQEVAP